MAGFRILGSTRTVEVQGGTKLVKVKEYHCTAVSTLPDGSSDETYFQFRRPATVVQATVRSVAQQFADRIEGVLNLPNVSDVIYSQDTSQGGRLQDRMTTYYATADGAITGDVESSLANFGPGYTGAQIADEISAAAAFLG